MIRRHQKVALWPMSEVAARLVEIRSVRHSGLDLLTWSSSHFDPKKTLDGGALSSEQPVCFTATIGGLHSVDGASSSAPPTYAIVSY
jgi:hypothetical protein